MYVVLGQRRSGTSMIAGVLHHLGVDMGPDPERSSERNPKGFFEDERFVDISRRILKKVENQEVNSLARLELDFEDEISELVESREEPWGFKDVNQVQTHKIFRKHLENPKYFVLYRNPYDIARSLQDWHEVPIYKAVDAVLSNYSVQQEFLKQCQDPVLTISFERAKQNPEYIVDKIIDMLEFEVSDKNRKNAINHIDPEQTSL